MIQATVSRSHDGLFTGLVVEGHAGAGPRGFDLVCAGVSAVAQTAVIALEEYLHIRPRVCIAEGHLSCVLAEDEDPELRLRASDILAAAWFGFKAIASEHPEHLKLFENRETG